MKQNKNIYKFIFGLVVLLFIIILVLRLCYDGLQIGKKDTFCKENYPPSINRITSLQNNDYWASSNVEIGYIKCCRNYYYEHEIKTECKIFKYEE